MVGEDAMLNQQTLPNPLAYRPLLPESLPGPTPKASLGEPKVTVGIPSNVLGLWIDLVRQASGVTTAPPRTTSDTLTQEQARALNCLPEEGLTMTVFARSLGVSSAGAAVIAERLISDGAARCTGKVSDRGEDRLFATQVGMRVATAHRRRQVETLDQLLHGMSPARMAVLTLAMEQLVNTECPPLLPSPAPIPAPDVPGWPSL
jgi:hypothetical protein